MIKNYPKFFKEKNTSHVIFMIIEPNSFEYNFLFALYIVLLSTKLILVIYLGKKVIKRRKEEDFKAFDFIFSVFVLMICAFISRLLYFYFDFVLTKFDSDTFYLVPNVIIWKLAGFIGSLGFAFVLFTIDKKVLNFKFKGIFTYIIIATALFILFYPVNTSEDFEFVSALGLIPNLIGSVIPIIFLYIGIKTPGLRKTAFIIAFGVIIYGIGANLVNEITIAPLREIYGHQVVILMFFLFLVFKITGLIMVSYGATKFSF
ncbi:MAG: hypothetical protein ACTSQJ_16985 [Promethearchaeota archaeon]